MCVLLKQSERFSWAVVITMKIFYNLINNISSQQCNFVVAKFYPFFVAALSLYFDTHYCSENLIKTFYTIINDILSSNKVATS